MFDTIDKCDFFLAYFSIFFHFGAKKLTFDEKYQISGHFQ
jgi:hypothetical protein